MTGGIVAFPSVMDLDDVKEMFSRYYVDPDIAQHNVPSKWKVKIYDNGKALLLVMVQSCKKMVLDYMFNVGSVGMSHIWIELEGPYEVVTPLTGTPRSLPILGTSTSCRTSLMVISLIHSLCLRGLTPNWSRRYRLAAIPVVLDPGKR
jgi:hypothetical protein